MTRPGETTAPPPDTTAPRPDEGPAGLPAPHEPAHVRDVDDDGLRRSQDGRILPPDVSEEAGEHP